MNEYSIVYCCDWERSRILQRKFFFSIEVHGRRNKLGVRLGGWVTVFCQMISQDWEGLRSSNLAQRWHLVRGWRPHLDFLKFFNCSKKFSKNKQAKSVNFFPFAWRHHAYVCKNSIYVAPPYKWILHTPHQTVRTLWWWSPYLCRIQLCTVC